MYIFYFSLEIEQIVNTFLKIKSLFNKMWYNLIKTLEEKMITIKTLLENTGSRNRALAFEHGLSFFVTVDDKSYLFDCSGGDKEEKMITIKTLLENTGSRNRALAFEHGLSFFVTVDDKSYLFDCSGGDKIIKNARKMNIDLSKIDTVICSHSHYDHSCGFLDLVDNFKIKKLITGKLSKIDTVICSHSHYDHSCGFLDLVDNFKIKKLITGKNYFDPKYSFDGMKYTYLGCGFNKDFLEDNGIEHIICDDMLELQENVYLVGNFKRNYDFEKSPARFVVERDGKIQIDDFRDEISLVIKTDEGLVVVTGCSHPGILNILSTIKERFGMDICAVYGGTHLVEASDERLAKTLVELKKLGVPGILNILSTIKERFGMDICAVYGGTHLVEASDERLAKTLVELKKLGVKLLGFSHCSGEKIVELIKNDKDFLSCSLNTGDEIKIF